MDGDVRQLPEILASHADQVLAILSDTADSIFFIWDIPSGKAYVSPAATRIYDLPDGPMGDVGGLRKILYQPDLPAATEHLEQLRDGRLAEMNIDLRTLDRQGRRIWVNLRGRPVRGPDGQVSQVVGSANTIDSASRADRVTGLLSESQLAIDFSGYLEAGQAGYLLLLGIDDFKTVNDRLGRAAGDLLLQKLAGLLEDSVGSAGRVYRMDGDRFAVVLLDKNRGAVNHFYLQIKDAYRESCSKLREGVFTTLSGGAAAWPEDSAEYNQLNQFADSALNAAKRTGKDRLFFFSQAAHEQYLVRISLRQDLQRCVSNNFEGFSLHYQPQISLADNSVHSAEALLRWNSPRHGPVPPLEFIPLLEKYGLICQVGRWVMEQALAQCKQWRARVPDFQVSINLSYIQLEKDDISGYLLYCLRKLALPGTAVLLEITESEQLQNFRSYNETLTYMNRIGVMVAIDDFGTGYSSLSYFKELRVDQIKIDRCFVARVQESEYDYRLIKFIVELAHSVDVAVCIEGIETAEELEALLPLEPDSLQGFYFGRPVPAGEFETTFMDNWKGLHTRHKELLARIHETNMAKPTAFWASEETLALFEELAEIVYICDPVTGELHYLNRVGRQKLGIAKPKGMFLEGALWNKGESPPAADTLRRREYRRWSFESKKLGVYCCSHDRLIPWGEGGARLGICVALPPGQRYCNW